MSKLGLLESYHDSTSWILLMSKPGDVRSTICQNRNLNTTFLPAKLSRSKVRGLQCTMPNPRASKSPDPKPKSQTKKVPTPNPTKQKYQKPSPKSQSQWWHARPVVRVRVLILRASGGVVLSLPREEDFVNRIISKELIGVDKEI